LIFKGVVKTYIYLKLKFQFRGNYYYRKPIIMLTIYIEVNDTLVLTNPLSQSRDRVDDRQLIGAFTPYTCHTPYTAVFETFISNMIGL